MRVFCVPVVYLHYFDADTMKAISRMMMAAMFRINTKVMKAAAFWKNSFAAAMVSASWV